MIASYRSQLLALFSLCLGPFATGATITLPEGFPISLPDGSTIIAQDGVAFGAPGPVAAPDSLNIGRGSRFVPTGGGGPFGGGSFQLAVTDVFAGQRLRIDKPTRLLGARAEFEILTGTPFLSIVPIPHDDWFPLGRGDLARRSTHHLLLDRAQGSAASGRSDFVLEPGDYAFILGGGLFGADISPGSLTLRNRQFGDERDFFASADQPVLWGSLGSGDASRVQDYDSRVLNLQLSTKVVPEPSTILFGLFALGFALLHRRRT